MDGADQFAGRGGLVHVLCIGNADETNAQIMWLGPGRAGGEWDILTIRIMIVFITWLWTQRQAPRKAYMYYYYNHYYL